jgi:hypothetical protein
MLAMLRVLDAGREWNAELSGRSEHGGGTATLWSLVRRGWVDRQTYTLTEAGRDALRLATTAPPPAARRE